MKITNKENLPLPLVQMASDNYEPVDKVYRVTNLLKGVREVILERRHWAALEKDCSEMIWLLFGTAAHGVLEKYDGKATDIKESRISCQFGDYTLSGQFDLFDQENGIVIDYKTTSVWKVVLGDHTDWRRQLLMYAYMLRQQGYEVNGGQIVAFLKDHIKRKARMDKTYPQLPVKTINFKFTDKDFDEIEDWINKRFSEVKQAEQLADDDLPLCTPEERYNDGDRWAVKAKGKKRALKVCLTKEDAEKYIKEIGGDEIEYRPGEDRKCTDYCQVAPFCNYWRNRYDANRKSAV